jgi:hypothetical protein
MTPHIMIHYMKSINDDKSVLSTSQEGYDAFNTFVFSDGARKTPGKSVDG